MSKVILGVNSNHADSSACIIVNGKIVAAAEEDLKTIITYQVEQK